jgi:phosphate transport system protein
MASHYEETLQRDIDFIRRQIREMADLVETALRNSLKSIQERNRQFAYLIILRDRQIDELEKQIDRLCLEFLVRQQPVAGHLRFAYAAIKVNAELERIGDYAESVARQSLKISTVESQRFYARFVEIANLSIQMLHDAVQAFLDQDAALATATMEIEKKANGMRDEINAELFQAFREKKILLDPLMPLLTIARRFERVADQAKNICEEVLYMCTGEFAKHAGTEMVRLLFVDRHNSCLSQMAEGIGNSLGKAGVLFSSAGLEPESVDVRAVSFLKDKGIDISRQCAKAVNRIPNLEHYQVIIALDKGAQGVYPSPPTKAVCLDWSIIDPSITQGPTEAVHAAYEEAYRDIEVNIRDLAEAILGDRDNPEKEP